VYKIANAVYGLVKMIFFIKTKQAYGSLEACFVLIGHVAV
jgi:hypothetical protein